MINPDVSPRMSGQAGPASWVLKNQGLEFCNRFSRQDICIFMVLNLIEPFIMTETGRKCMGNILLASAQNSQALVKNLMLP